MCPSDNRSLWQVTTTRGILSQRVIADAGSWMGLSDLFCRRNHEAELNSVLGRSVLVSSVRQLPAVTALLQLDGIARRVLLCPPDLPPAHLATVIAEAEVDAIVTDGSEPAPQSIGNIPAVDPGSAGAAQDRSQQTEWLLFTSGTTGRPKIVVHSLASLTGPLDDGLNVANDAVWITFYDIRRYGGLQILLRALLGGGSMVLSQANEPVADFLTCAGKRLSHTSPARLPTGDWP
jgi:acyl-CoA synthetase (AMP-forming)/AMP-acid ligase II